VYNDFSNMNAGFFPPHVSHNLGIDVDVEFGTIHNNRNFAVSRTAAKKLIELLNSSVGEHIDYIYVMFPTTQDNDFWNEIRNAVLDDDSRVVPENLANTVNPQDPGVHAQGRIRWSPGHEGHFHIRWKRQ
jgi:murein endopeptidase